MPDSERAPPSRRPIPAHLRCFVVEQDYDQYNVVDQAVWRFVLLHTNARLTETAHPAYRKGLEQTGILVDHIPRISEMDACLEQFGWRAVAVDGFIPPRAFQEFQAEGLLPIAADIRSKDHLVYTPAPDIVHEAAGHAPILPDPKYAAYIRRIGRVGARAFASPEDARVYRAIYTLSEVKESPDATSAQIEAAEAALGRALADVGCVSEATRMARLYWWTAEYGLVGAVADYKIYGAGLLSSLWESYSCHDPAVKKIRLSAACTEVSYDITRPQPQLFVADDFEHLDAVLDEVEATLSYRIGGAAALDNALASGEVATFEFHDGSTLTGVLERIVGAAAAARALCFSGRTRLALPPRAAAGPVLEFDGYTLPLGRLVDEDALRLGEGEVQGRKLDLSFDSGVRVEGELSRVVRAGEGEALAVVLQDSRYFDRGAPLERCHGLRAVPLSAVFRTAHAGAADRSYFPATELPSTRVPKPRRFSQAELGLRALYEEALAVWQSGLGSQVVPVFASIHAELQRHYSDEWLLRWNLLESLYKLGQRVPLASALQSELEEMELRFQNRQPIASGLRYLASLSA
jgi:phenylalanine-4-hydroxylase